jgi:hypothetical protein
VRTVAERLRDAAELFEERNAAYGANYRTFGPVLHAMFPKGFGSKPLTAEEWGRLAHVVMMVLKLTRYSQNLRKGGHKDSMEDLAVYAMMAAELDEGE